MTDETRYRGHAPRYSEPPPHYSPFGDVVNATGGGGGGGYPASSGYDRPHKRRRQKRVVPNSFHVPVWGTFQVSAARYYIATRAIVALVSIALVFALWIAQKVPTLPPAWYRYCFLYYAAQIIPYVVNLFLPVDTMVNTIYGIFAIISVLIFGFQVFLLVQFGYFVYHCWWVADLPYSCTATFWTDVPVLVATLFLFGAGFMTMVYFVGITWRTSGTSKASLVEYIPI
jgi:hypothetical protein